MLAGTGMSRVWLRGRETGWSWGKGVGAALGERAFEVVGAGVGTDEGAGTDETLERAKAHFGKLQAD